MINRLPLSLSASKNLIRPLKFGRSNLIRTMDKIGRKILSKFVEFVVIKNYKLLNSRVLGKKSRDLGNPVFHNGGSPGDISIQTLNAENGAQGLECLAFSPGRRDNDDGLVPAQQSMKVFHGGFVPIFVYSSNSRSWQSCDVRI